MSGVVICFLLIAWAAIARATAPTSNTAQTRFDTLIVLGDRSDADGNPTPTQLARVTEAVHEYEQGVAPHIIFTGGPAHNHFVEAEGMARAAEAQGIPASVIFQDQQALDTMQNACNSLSIMRNHGWESAEVISSPTHLPRASLIFSSLPIQWRVHPAPPLGPISTATTAALNLDETLKTVRFLLWARRKESCQL